MIWSCHGIKGWNYAVVQFAAAADGYVRNPTLDSHDKTRLSLFPDARRCRRNRGIMNLYQQSPFDIMPILQTEHLILRKLTMRDAEDIFAYSRDPEVARHVLWDAHEAIGESRSYIRYMLRKYRQGEPSSWGLQHKASGRIIGTIGYMWYQRENNACEVGYSLSRAHWGQGLMTEALKAVLDYSFDTLNLHRVEAQYELTNPASGAVMRKAGMSYEGTLRGRLYNKGRYVDVAVFSMVREDRRNRMGR